ncbi:hypothetical protein LCGC14_2417900 [marine sediment metagenome]|uniref:Uncharacterized protein n=1 Tax=marine sediment metagenome TaxID=412755 RepID=A0A0F9CCP9_9ZZZZ
MIEKNIILNVENTLYDPAKKKAKEQGIVFEEYLWRLVKKDFEGKKVIPENKVREVIDKDWLLFSDRLNLEKEFLKWAKENNVVVRPMAVIGWFHPKIQNKFKKELGLE